MVCASRSNGAIHLDVFMSIASVPKPAVGLKNGVVSNNPANG